MNKKKYKAKERLIIVLEGIKGNVSLGELCNQYGISQQTYYNWRDRLLSEGSKIFSYGGVDREKDVLKQEGSCLNRNSLRFCFIQKGLVTHGVYGSTWEVPPKT